MKIKPFIPKTNSELPDSYGLKVFYVTGKSEEFEVAQHNLNKECGMLEFATKDDLWNWVPLSSVLRIEYDKRLSQIIALRDKKQKELKL